MLFAATESQQHISNNYCSYNIALCRQSVMVNVYTALLSVNHNFRE